MRRMHVLPGTAVGGREISAPLAACIAVVASSSPPHRPISPTARQPDDQSSRNSVELLVDRARHDAAARHGRHRRLGRHGARACRHRRRQARRSPAVDPALGHPRRPRRRGGPRLSSPRAVVVLGRIPAIVGTLGLLGVYRAAIFLRARRRRGSPACPPSLTHLLGSSRSRRAGPRLRHRRDLCRRLAWRCGARPSVRICWRSAMTRRRRGCPASPSRACASPPSSSAACSAGFAAAFYVVDLSQCRDDDRRQHRARRHRRRRSRRHQHHGRTLQPARHRARRDPAPLLCRTASCWSAFPRSGRRWSPAALLLLVRQQRGAPRAPRPAARRRWAAP